ncbi:MAG: preprotein translocase subunit YajC, partial [Gemmataceae bacterium]|nr:preprotein translocase subunit YajC [Gemmataceae bacterium]
MTIATVILLAQEGGEPGPGAGPGSPLFPLFIVVLVLLFLMLVVFPAQTRRQKREQEKLMASIKRGSKVLTNAGIVGIVVSVREGDDEIVIRSEDSRLRIKKSVVVQILGAD